MVVSDHRETDPAAEPAPPGPVARLRVLAVLDPFPAALLILAVAVAAARLALAGGVAGLGWVG